MVDVTKLIPSELDTDSLYSIRARTINSFGAASGWSESLVIDTNVGFRRLVYSDTGPIYYFENGKVLFSLYESEEVRQNQLKNPSMESLTGWTRYGTSAQVSIAVSTIKLFGTSSILASVLVLTPTLQLGIQTDSTQYALASPGQSWTASAYVYPSNDGMFFTVNLRFYKSDNTFISEVVGKNRTGDNAVFLRVHTTAKAPALTAKVGMAVVMAKNTAVGRSIRVDGCLLEKSATLKTYFDGSTAPGLATWDATPAHTSSSTLQGATSVVTVNKDIHIGGSYNGVLRVYKQDAINPTFVMNTDEMTFGAYDGATFFITDVPGNTMFEVQGPTGTVIARGNTRVPSAGLQIIGATSAYLQLYTDSTAGSGSAGTLDAPGTRTGYIGFTPTTTLTIKNEIADANINISTNSGTISLVGMVTLSQAPSAPNHAATMAYVDSAVFIPDIYEVASQAAMLALPATRGDYALRSDVKKTFILQITPASTLGNWAELPSDASAAADNAVAVHEAATDPHTGYLKESSATSTYVPLTRSIATTAPLRIDGAASGDLSAAITLSANVFTASTTGIVPTGGTDSSNYLRGNATWANPHNQITIDTFFRTGQFVIGGSSGSPVRQIRLSHNGTLNYPHDILTMHNAGADTNNQIIFRTWKVGDPVAGPPSNTILTLDGTLITAAKPIALPAGNPTDPLHAAHKGYAETAASNAVATHVALGDAAHPEYLSEAEMDAAILSHEEAPNPHDQYLTESEADSLYINVLGDTMSGQLTMNHDIIQIGSGRKIVGRIHKSVNGGTGAAPLAQIHLGFSGNENYEHQILTGHDSGTTANNKIVFRLWKVGDPHTIPSNTVLTLSGDLITAAYPVDIPATPTQITHAASKSYVDAQVASQLTQAEADAIYVNITGDTMTSGALTFAVSPGGAGRFGQHLGLYGNALGIGSQTSNLYFRTAAGNSFRFYSGGSHNDAAANAGGGTELLNITDASMQFKTRNLSTELYVQSRTDNLVTNGSALLLDNTNFSGFIYNSAQSFAGGGSFEAEGKAITKTADELIPVDPVKRYRLAYAIIMFSKQQPADTPLHYGYVEPFDADRNLISSNMVMKFPGSTMTTLAVQLNPGATTITLTSAVGWYSAGGVPEAHQRSIAIYPYTNAQGYTYPSYTYTRNTYTDMWAAGGISGNIITLRVPWAGATWPIGTPVANAQSGNISNTYDYIAGSASVSPLVWTIYEGTIGLFEGETILSTPTPGTVVVGNAYQQSTGGFRWGTAFVRVGWLLGYPATNLGTAKYYIDDVTFESIQQKSERYAFTATTGTPPFTVASTTMVSNLNADTVDGIQGASIITTTGGQTISGNLTISPGDLFMGSADGQHINMYSTTQGFGVQGSGQSMYSRATNSFYWYKGGTHDSTEGVPGGVGTTLMQLTDTTFKYKTNEIWHAGNDGHRADGSGVNADLLDDKHAIAFANREEMEALLGDLLFVGIYDAADYIVSTKDQPATFNGAVPNTITGWNFDPPPDASVDFRCDCTIPTIIGGITQRPVANTLIFAFTTTQLSSSARMTDLAWQSVSTNYPVEVQTVTPTGTISGGTFTITILGVTTAGIAWNATNATIKTAINTAIPGNTVTVGGGPANTTPFTITFPAIYGDASEVVINSSGLTGTNPLLTPTTTTAGWPSPGARIQLRATWNATTDTLTHYWRLGGPDLNDDSISAPAWITLGSLVAAGKLLYDTAALQAIGGQPSFYYTGNIYRVTSSTNNIATFDMKGFEAALGPATFMPTLGPALTSVGSGILKSASSTGVPLPEWSGATPTAITYRHGMYWVCGSTKELDFIDADYSGRYDIPKTFVVTNKVLTSNVATLTIVLQKTVEATPVDSPHNIKVGSTIIVTDVDNIFDGKYLVKSTTVTTVSYDKVNTNVSTTPVSPTGQMKVVFDEARTVTYGDWIVAIDPFHQAKVDADNLVDDLTWGEVIWQYIPFSTETYVKQQMELHTDPIRSPDPHTQYLLPAEADVFYAALIHSHDADMNAAIIDHMGYDLWDVLAWSWNNGIVTLTVAYDHNLLPGASFDLIGVKSDLDTHFDAATPSLSTKWKVVGIEPNAATPNTTRLVKFDYAATPTSYINFGSTVYLSPPGGIKNDPHTQYLIQAEADALYAFKEHEHSYEPLGTMNAHVGQTDPHIQYLLETDAAIMYSPIDHNHDLVYALKDHTHPILYEVHPTDGAVSAEIYIGAATPSIPKIGDLWFDTFTIDPQPPSAPTNFVVSQYYFAPYLQISWSPWPVAENISSVKLQRSTTGVPASFVDIKTLTAPILTPTTWLDSSGIVQNTVYYYRLYATNVAGTGTMTVISKISGNTPPSLPDGLSLVNTGIGAQEFSWNEPLGHTHEVFFNGVSQGILTSPVSRSGLAENTEYTFGVRAIDTAATPNTPAYSAIAYATTMTLNAVPPTLTGLTATSVTATSIAVSWNAPSPAINDLLDYEVSTTGLGGIIKWTTSRSTTFSSLTPLSNYTITVKARDRGTPTLSSAAHSIVVATIGTDGTTLPPRVTFISLKPEVVYGRMYARFTVPAGVTQYKIDRSEDLGGVTGSYITDINWKNTTAGTKVEILKASAAFAVGTTIHCRVWTKNAAGHINWSYFPSYTLVATPIRITADGTNHWRDINGGQWNGSGNLRPFQGYYDASYPNAKGFWFYGTQIKTALYNNGLRTVTSGKMLFKREACGLANGASPIVQMHSLTVNPGTVNSGATNPTLYGTATSLGLSVTPGGAALQGTLPAAFVTDLVAGISGGNAVYGVAVYDADGDPYMCFSTVSEYPTSGQLEFAHLG